MKLEVGKIYETRDGNRVQIRVLDVDTSASPVVGSILDSNGAPVKASWYALGGESCDRFGLDLLKEWSPPLRIKLPAYKWAAMDECGEWFAYEKQPVCAGHRWAENNEDVSTTYIELSGLAEGTYTGDWKKSLHTIEPDGTLKPHHE